MPLTLHTVPGHARACKALIAAQYNAVPVAVNYLSKKDLADKSWSAKSPLGRVPVLETSNGQYIFEASAIARYIARLNLSTDLLGKSFSDQAMVDSWVDFASNELELPGNILCYPIMGHSQAIPDATEHAKKDLLAALQVLNTHLATRTFLVGNSVTLADICCVSALIYPMKLVLDKTL